MGIEMSLIAGRSIGQWRASHPLIGDVIDLKEVCWFNPDVRPVAEALPDVGLTQGDVDDAAARLSRFAPYLARVFRQTAETHGVIDSPIRAAPRMQQAMEERYARKLPGRLWLKLDSHLPISGSIKARGGIYEVLKHAENLALNDKLIRLTDDYALLDSERARAFFSQHRIAVGSTDNLGLSIGIMGAAMGFKVTVHMSSDARQWKKDGLTSRGVTVVEHASDYSAAVAEGRRQTASDPICHFVDDENSKALFLGCAVAGARLKAQFASAGIAVDAEHPLFVYLPCGVGGGPGGVAFGLKLAFGDHVHCIFAEPTHSPCMLLGVHTGLHDAVAVHQGRHLKPDGRGASMFGRCFMFQMFQRVRVSACCSWATRHRRIPVRLAANSDAIRGPGAMVAFDVVKGPGSDKPDSAAGSAPTRQHANTIRNLTPLNAPDAVVEEGLNLLGAAMQA